MQGLSIYIPHCGLQILVGKEIGQTVFGEVDLGESVKELLREINLVGFALGTQVLDGLNLADFEVEPLKTGIAKH